MGKDKEEKEMAAPAMPIEHIQIEMSEKDYNDFVEFATKKKTSFTPEQQKIRDRFKKFEQNRNKKK
ncbi:hypothetical protein [Paenibacillus thalictri]|uniref:Uncharacterized protein n=1 Tax=Paenibacillus thalictri TaxID=2527873 RepID=A0A4V2J4P8_9BACL|nr:hypothetical protein [Paenibacillus thalictri]TBL80642.1 hypothetical protein EYB31_05275 [Paenibacillus thalictri]